MALFLANTKRPPRLIDDVLFIYLSFSSGYSIMLFSYE